MADLIQLRRDTKANWATVNPVLELGEPGLETDTRKIKYGDGITAWNNLPYGGGAGDGAYDISEANNGATYATLSAALAAIPDSEYKGGMSIKFILRTNTGTEESPVYKDEYVQYRLMKTTWSAAVADWQGVDSEPKDGSRNLVESGVVYRESRSIVDSYNTSNADLDFSDEQDNVVMRLSNGHIKTKNFNSSKNSLPEADVAKVAGIEAGAQVNDVVTNNTGSGDLDFSDEQDNVVMRLSNGHIKTKNFDSRDLIITTLYHRLRVLNHPLHGKKVGFLGDSITYGYGLPSSIRETARYSSKFCTLVGCTEVNLGVSGTCIASNTVNNKNDTRFVTRVTQANIGDLDFLFIFGGTNDFSYDSKPIGEYFSINQITPPSNLIGNTQLGPIADTDTFAGGLHDLILAIRAINPNLQMCFLTPLSRGRYLNGLSYTHDGITYSGARPNTEDSNKNGNYLYEYEDAIIAITKFYAIPSIRTISLFNNRAADDGTSDMFQADGDNIHLTVAGNERLAKLLFNWTINNVIF